jgi:hypothetical protein
MGFKGAECNNERVKLLQAQGFKSADVTSVLVTGNPFPTVELSGKNPGIYP